MCLNFAAKVGNVCYNTIKQTFHLCYKSAVCTTGQGLALPYTLNIMGAHAIVYNAAGTPCVYKRPPFAFQKTAFYRLKGHLLQGKRRPSANTLAVSTLQDVQKKTCAKAAQQSYTGSLRMPDKAHYGRPVDFLIAQVEKKCANSCIFLCFY